MQQIALIDGNNFFVSCERVFQPELKDKPVIVLSSNDGCAISRSNEAKALGIKMGEPWFLFRNHPKFRDLVVRSSNFALYADMSNRFMRVLSAFSPIQEIYSIDESFLDLTGFSDIRDRTFLIKDTVMKYLGLPVCVGVGSTKTLAKLANYVAKKHPKSPGVFNLNALNDQQQSKLLGAIDIDELWGIGRRTSAKLKQQHIYTVLDLREANLEEMRFKYGVTMERIIMELRGTSCIDLVEVSPPRKQILSSRSFGQPITDLFDLENAISFFAAKTTRKLRDQHSVCSLIQVFIHTSRFTTTSEQYHSSITINLSEPTQNTHLITKAALSGLGSIYKKGMQYKRAGVCLLEISSSCCIQGDLFHHTFNGGLSAVMDTINDKFGEGTIRLSIDDSKKRNWSARKDLMSDRYTTKWDELPVCFAK